jgi:hypothetical protein
MNSPSLTIKDTTRVVQRALGKGHYLAVAVIVALIYSVFYIFFTGIIQPTPEPIQETIKIPYVKVSWRGEIGTVPWIVIYPDRHTVFSMTFAAMLSTFLNSSLVGINGALILYRHRVSKFIQCQCKSTGGSISLAGIIPSIFSVFACCGGGLLLAIFGVGALASLRLFGPIFSIAGIVILAFGVFLNAKTIRENLYTSKKNLYDF